MKTELAMMALAFCLLSSCTPPQIPSTATVQPNLPNPASAHCVEQGYRSEIRTAADGSQSGVCIFPDGSECDEWAYFRGECKPASQTAPTPSPAPTAKTAAPTPAPTAFPTPLPISPADYQGWWTYTHPVYNFSIMLPEDWVVEEITTSDPGMNGHTLSLRPREIAPEAAAGKENVRMAFRRVGEDARLWPTGVGQGEFRSQGTLDVAGQPALRVLLVCPRGDVTAIWYHEAEGQPNIARDDLEFGFIFSAGSHCEPGISLGGKVQRLGEMIIASLKTS